MFKSLYRIQQHPDRQLGEAVLTWKGAVLMVLIFISEQFIAIGVNALLAFLNANFHTNYDEIGLNLFTDLAALALLIFFFGRFFWVNLYNMVKEFKAIYLLGPLVCYGGAMVGNMIVNMILMMIRGSMEQSTNNEIINDMITRQPLTLILLTVVLAPVIEESVFRAGLCRPLTANKNYFVKALGYLIPTFLFALMHVYQYAFFATDANGAMYLTFNADEFLSILMYIPMAISFAVCATVCKNFWGSVMCHMLTNGVAVSLMLLLMLFKDYLLN